MNFERFNSKTIIKKREYVEEPVVNSDISTFIKPQFIYGDNKNKITNPDYSAMSSVIEQTNNDFQRADLSKINSQNLHTKLESLVAKFDKSNKEINVLVEKILPLFDHLKKWINVYERDKDTLSRVSKGVVIDTSVAFQRLISYLKINYPNKLNDTMATIWDMCTNIIPPHLKYKFEQNKVGWVNELSIGHILRERYPNAEVGLTNRQDDLRGIDLIVSFKSAKPVKQIYFDVKIEKSIRGSGKCAVIEKVQSNQSMILRVCYGQTLRNGQPMTIDKLFNINTVEPTNLYRKIINNTLDERKDLLNENLE